MKTWLKYLLAFLIALILVVVFILSKDIFNITDEKYLYKILCNSFFSSGVIILCSGLLVFSSNEGTFDIFIFGFKKFGDLFKKKEYRTTETFFDYRMEQKEKKISFLHLIITGIIFICISLIFLKLYYNL